MLPSFNIDKVKVAAEIAKILADIWGIKRDKGRDAAAKDERIRELERKVAELEAKARG